MIKSTDIVLVHYEDGTFYKPDFEDYFYYLNSNNNDNEANTETPQPSYKVYHLQSESLNIPPPKNMKLRETLEKLFTSERYTSMIPYLNNIIPLLTQSYKDYYINLNNMSDKIQNAIDNDKLQLSYCTQPTSDLIDFSLFLSFILSNEAFELIVE